MTETWPLKLTVLFGLIDKVSEGEFELVPELIADPVAVPVAAPKFVPIVPTDVVPSTQVPFWNKTNKKRTATTAVAGYRYRNAFLNRLNSL